MPIAVNVKVIASRNEVPISGYGTSKACYKYALVLEVSGYFCFHLWLLLDMRQGAWSYCLKRANQKIHMKQVTLFLVLICAA